MSCSDWEEQIAAGAPDAALERHLAACGACRAAAEAYRRDTELLKAAHLEPVPPAHYAAVRARVLAQLEGRRAPAWRRLWVCGLAAGSVFVAFMLIPRPVRTPVARQVPAEAQTAKAPTAAPMGERQPQLAARMPQTRGRARGTRLQRTGGAKRPPALRAQEPLVVKLLTDDPNVVIYWIADGKGD